MWASPTWHSYARTFQLLGALTSASFHGFITLWVYKKRLGLSQTMLILQLLISVLLAYTLFAIFLQKKNKDSKKSNWLVFLIVFDVLFCGVLLGIITLLAHAGLPLHCAGLTRDNYEPDDAPPLQPGTSNFSTNRFSNEKMWHPGGLDKFCGLERAYFYVANALVFSYIITISIAMARIVEQRLMKSYSLDAEINLKDLDVSGGGGSELPSPNTTGAAGFRGTTTAQLSEQNLEQHNPSPAMSEGIITRSNSLRSTFTAATSSTHSGPQSSSNYSRPSSTSGPYRSNTVIPRRPVGSGFGQQPLSSSSSSSLPSFTPQQPPVPRLPPPPHHNHFTPMPLDEVEDAALIVSDGMRHQPQQLQQPQSHQQPQHYRQHSASQPYGNQFSRMPMLLEEDQISVANSERTDVDAHHALVSDGMRPSAPMLPPYEPGNGGGGGGGTPLQGYGKGDR